MFTGIIEKVGTVTRVDAVESGRALAIEAGRLTASLRPGDSIAVNGVCLTVEASDARAFRATAVAETLARTTLGGIAAGDVVNLERAATVEQRLGGHIVEGHVDGVGVVVSIAGAGDSRTVEIEVPQAVHALAVEKGSIAVDGVSLTIAAKGRGRRITVAVVPHTLRRTTIAAYAQGRRVNVEGDVIAKYVFACVRRLHDNASTGDR